jgi:hypothetical protein
MSAVKLLAVVIVFVLIKMVVKREVVRLDHDFAGAWITHEARHDGRRLPAFCTSQV